ncbi:tRNA dihydrouridine synthase [Algisphaera agarilytica]|uniref:tRNA-dihydrouridine synthase n=1 Tax=Algisphaera agarilytica TaxID=1385975 RepID=A0A7X0LMA9_9BACT|nr:tRNA-dihydrouridine synthase family protein [Algisphaera agarilytica]MBB6430833.1 tRNA-dihydrouridine synthase [Algisphaera agarilytica]
MIVPSKPAPTPGSAPGSTPAPESTPVGSPPLSLGGVAIDAPFYQAGLAGYSDAAMRMVARKHGSPYCITEAMLDAFLIAGGKGLKHAEIPEGDHPICGQLMGSHPDDIAAGAKILVGLGYDVVDVNLACPVKKIKKKCRGGHLLSVPEEAIAILEAVKAAVPAGYPLTTKLRRAYDDTPEMEENFHQVFQAAMRLGYAGATVHCRTVQQKYVGPGKWEKLEEIARRYKLGKFSEPISDLGIGVSQQDSDAPSAATPSLAAPNPKSEIQNPKFTLGGSGDIWTAHDIFRMLEQTGVDWVSVARGCIGNPWIFTQARAIMASQAAVAPTIHEQRDVLLEHFDLSVRLHGEGQASRMMRKFGIKFSRHHPQADAIKQSFIKVKSTDDWRAVLAYYYSQDGPGVEGDAALPEESKAYESCEANV